MKRNTLTAIAGTLALALAATTWAGSVSVKLKTGSTWRGDVNDLVKVSFLVSGRMVDLEGRLVDAKGSYIIIEGEIAGEVKKKTIFTADIRKLETLSEDSEAAASLADAPRRDDPRDGATPKMPAGATAQKGVFVLPMSGPVGINFRNEEIEMIGEEADKYGRGQIIVLVISSNGGLVIESEMIAETIAELQKRHRVIAWIDKAISAGAMTAMCCEEIYFMTHGTAGSVTTLAGGRSLPEAAILDHMEHFRELAERNGYSKHIANSMKFNHYMCSYDKDEETGKVTFYGDMSGKYLLSDEKSNLTFNASNALHCGFSKGTADTEADLARLLNLPEWYEVSDYGRKIHDDWQATVKRAEEEIPRLMARLSYYKSSGGAEEKLGAEIDIYEKLLRWWDRCENYCLYNGVPPREWLEATLKELRRQAAQMRRNRRQ